MKGSENQIFKSELLDELLAGETVVYVKDDKQHELTMMGVFRKDEYQTNVIIGKEKIFDYETKMIEDTCFVIVCDDYTALYTHVQDNYENEPTGIYETQIVGNNYFVWQIKKSLG